MDDLKQEQKHIEEAMAMTAVTKLYSEKFLNKEHEPNGYSTPPDYLLSYESGEVLLEVVNSDNFDVVRDDQGCQKRLVIPSNQGVNKEILRKKIDKKLSTLLKPNEVITIMMDMPSRLDKNLDKAIAKKLTELYTNNKFKLMQVSFGNHSVEEQPRIAYSDWVSFTIKKFNLYMYARIMFGVNVHFKQTQIMLDADGEVCQVFIEPLYKGLEYSVEAQATYVLTSNIARKYKKLSNIKIPAAQQLLPKWLAIINNNITLEVTDYQAAFNQLSFEYLVMLDKVFIIDRFNHQANELIR